uniref:Uncharacterized protein n=1 Tax=Aureoumbra lagunensis TaxID=44058 RepID=A0A7S3JR54_9STRA|mmetsp:Transcript_21046/g.27287  ORF Transcript_21046/g.27287 Transcript_21046/m.27287 type:complete len:192 (-) Transcript_21046:120-695(-)
MSRYVWNNETMRMEEVPMTEKDLSGINSTATASSDSALTKSKKDNPSRESGPQDEDTVMWRRAAAEIGEEAEMAIDSAKLSLSRLYDTCSEALGLAPSNETKAIRAPPESWIDPKRQLDPDGYRQERKAMNESERQTYLQKYNIKRSARSNSPSASLSGDNSSSESKIHQKPGWLDDLYEADPSDLWDLVS